MPADHVMTTESLPAEVMLRINRNDESLQIFHTVCYLSSLNLVFFNIINNYSATAYPMPYTVYFPFSIK